MPGLLNRLCKIAWDALSYGFDFLVVFRIRLSAEWVTFLRPPFRYDPLEPNQIRVLKVLPPLTARQSEPIQCYLEYVSLKEYKASYERWEEATGYSLELRPHKARKAWCGQAKSRHERPPLNEEGKYDFEEVSRRVQETARFAWGDYVAVSYCWGWDANEPSRRIILNDQYVPVTESLEAALQAIRASDETATSDCPLRCWADALCIDQSNNAEREREILRIKEIYANAMAVLVHVGPESEDSAYAMYLLQKIAREQAQGIDCEASLLKQRIQPSAADVKAYTAIVKLLSRPYWRRLWIIQELAMSDDTITVGCGNHKILFSEVAAATKFICLNIESVGMIVGEVMAIDLWGLNASTWVIVWADRVRDVPRRLESIQNSTYLELRMPLLILAQNAEAKEDLDRIYGLLGLMPESIKSKMKPYIDYKLPVETAFVAFSKAIIESTGTLDIIFAKNFEQTMYPSWATDWRLRIDRAGLPHDWQLYCYDYYDGAYDDFRSVIDASRELQADGGRKSKADFQGCLLTCSGFLIGTVDGVASGVTGLHNTFLSSPHVQPQSNSNPYGDQEATTRALIHTLFANPIWGDLEEPALFHIPWIAGDLYSTQGDDISLFAFDEHMNQYMTRMLERGWQPAFGGRFFTFEAFRRCLGQFRVGGKPFHQYFTRDLVQCAYSKQRITLDMATVVGAHVGRRLITLDTGHFGLAPGTVQQGDGIYIIMGCSFPVVLRPSPGTALFGVVGECYVEGFAKGEAMDDLDKGKYQIQDICLC